MDVDSAYRVLLTRRGLFRRTVAGIGTTAVASLISLAVLVSRADADEISIVLQQERHGFHGCRDVSISADSRISNRNLGTQDFIHLWPEGNVSLVYFDLARIPQTAIVKEASLEFFCVSVGFSKEEINRPWDVGVYECRQKWSEGTGTDKGSAKRDGATLDSFDGSSPWPHGSARAAAGELLATTTCRGPERRWYVWQIKPDLLNAWASHQKDNNGFIIFGKAPGKAISLASRENAEREKRPILRLKLDLPPSEVDGLGSLLATDITWQQYFADCGLDAQRRNEARTEESFRIKYRGRVIEWSGVITSIGEKSVGSGFVLGVRMEPTDAVLLQSSDVLLRVPEKFKKRVLDLNRGDRILFTGRIESQGGSILPHQLQFVDAITR